MKVRFVQLGGNAIETDVPAGSSVADAAAKAGLSLDGFSVRISGDQIIGPSEMVPTREGISLVVAPKVEGGV